MDVISWDAETVAPEEEVITNDDTSNATDVQEQVYTIGENMAKSINQMLAVKRGGTEAETTIERSTVSFDGTTIQVLNVAFTASTVVGAYSGKYVLHLKFDKNDFLYGTVYESDIEELKNGYMYHYEEETKQLTAVDYENGAIYQL